VNKPDGFVVN